MKDEGIYIKYALDCIARIERYSSGGRQAFLESDLIQDAVLRNLQTLSASIQRLSEAVRTANPDVEWRAISGFRNVLVHDYLGIDIHRIWQIVENDLPLLRRQLQDVRERL